MDEIDPKQFGSLVKQARLHRHWSQEKLAEMADSDQSTVQRVEVGKWKRVPSDLPRILHTLQIFPHSFGSLLLRQGTVLSTRHVLVPSNITADSSIMVYGMAHGDSGTSILSAEPIEVVARPAFLEGVKDAYGVRITGESMIPAFRPGDIAFVHPHLVPLPEADEVVLQKDDHGTRYGLIKTFMGKTNLHWKLRQWQPKKDFGLPIADWPICHVVVARNHRR
jgi:transcriptional regulator with XRE-family HTH domain